MRKALAIELFAAERVVTTLANPGLLKSQRRPAVQTRLVDAIEVAILPAAPYLLSFRLLFTRDGHPGYVDYTYQGEYSILWDESAVEAENEED